MKTRIPMTLMLELEYLFPPMCIGPEQSLRAADRYAGKVELVGWLRQHFNNQNVDGAPAERPIDRDPHTGVLPASLVNRHAGGRRRAGW